MKRLLPVVIVAASLLTFAVLARGHTIGSYATETDFYHLYAPGAEQISAGKFPENSNQPPGYPALVALVSLATGDVFVSAKWISIVSAALAGLLVFFLCSRLFGYWAGVGAQLILMVSGPFPRYALSASTDVLFLLLCLAALLCLMTDRLGPCWRVGSAGAVAAAACLVRANGIFLVPAFLLAILVLNVFRAGWRKRFGLAALLFVVLLITASPWLYLNNRHNGSPFYSTAYLNMALQFYPDLTGGRMSQDGSRLLSERFHSLGDVLRYNPRRMRRYPLYVWANVRHSLAGELVSPPVAVLALAGTVWVLIRRRTNEVCLVLSAGACYFLLVSLSVWETRHYFFIAVIYAGLASYVVTDSFEMARKSRYAPRPGLGLVWAAAAGAIWLGAFAQARADVSTFLADPSTEVLGACQYIDQQDSRQVRILARKPHLPFICRREWVFFPLVGSLDELRRWLETHPVDYVAFGDAEQLFRPEIAELRQPGRAPSWLKVAWAGGNPPFVLYVPAVDRVR